jgi:3-hydroxyisobutyrate dehydrogenase
MKLAFIGIGLMGAPMARRLVDGGHDVALWNRNRDKLTPLVAYGAQAAASPADAARGAEIVMLCVTDAAAVEAVVFGPAGVAETIAPPAILVDFSSISPEATRRLGERLRRERGSSWIDAPVSGGVPGAEQGKLVVMAGGDEAAIERARPALAALAASITPMGPLGAGQTTKLCNQMIVGCNLAVIAEAIKLAQDAGVDAARLPDCFKGGFADSLPLQIFGRRMASGSYDPPLAAADILLKDLDTACDLARQTVTPLPMTALASALYRLLKARGRGKEDPAALISLLG